MGVVFFPSLPFMGVMLFPSFALGNASGRGGTLLVPLSLFFILLSLPLLSSPSHSFPLFFHITFSLFPFLPHKLFSSLYSSPLFHLFHFLLLPFILSFFLSSFIPRLILLFFFSSAQTPSILFFFLGNCLYFVLPRCNH